MEILDNMGNEDMEREGSATIATAINTSLDYNKNVPSITFSPYYPHSLFVAAGYILAYLFIFLLCMLGNILVCIIVLGNRNMRTVINFYILNLAVSDLLVGIFCIPTTLVDSLITGWPFSNTVCKMSGFVQGVSVSASVFTLVVIAVERFRCLVYPLQPKPSVLTAMVAIVLIWMLAVVIMCPAAVALTVKQVHFHYLVYKDDFNHTYPLHICYENFAKPQMTKIYTVVLFVHIYLLPLIIITLMYGRIGIKMWYSVIANRQLQVANLTANVEVRGNRQPIIPKKKVKVIKMLVLVALLFMLSWLPLWTLMMMIDYAKLNRNQLDLITSYIFPFAHWLAFANSSVNPIIYGYYNENFKKGFQAVCKSRPFCWLMQCQPSTRKGRQGRKGRSVQVMCRNSEFKEASRNRNLVVLETRNQVHHNNKMIDTTEVNRSAKVGCVVVQSERCLSDHGLEMAVTRKKASVGEQSQRITAPVVSVHKAWEN